MHRSSLFAVLFCAVLTCSMSQADDWPQWRGPQRDGIWRETGIVRTLPATGPPVTWRTKVGGGYAGPAVADGRVFVTDYLTGGDTTPDPDKRNSLQGTERVLCFDESSGELLWQHEYPRAYNISYPAGPRATPTVDGDRVYVLGAEGDLTCLRVDDGDVLWSRQLQEEYGTKTPIWGFAAHPLVDGNKLICTAGGQGSAAIALDKMTGKELWRALTTTDIGYSPPTIIQAGGRRQLLIWHSKSLNGLDPETGKVYWSQPLEPDYAMSIIPPIHVNDLLFVGAIKDKSMLLRLAVDRPNAQVVWIGKKDRGVGPSHSPVFVDREDPEHLYGVDRRGDLRCVKLATGEQVWTTYALMASKRPSSSGSAFLVKNGDRYLITSETGELVIAKLSPSGYEEISRSQPLLEPTHTAFGRAVVWSHPAFANGAMFARNDKELIRVSLAAN